MSSALSIAGASTPPGGSAPPLLVAERLVKRFGPTEALRGVSVSIDAGEIVAIMGPSGSGKSTLLHCLAGILLPDGGVTRFAGRDLAGLNERERSHLRLSEFGFVFQYGQLVPDLSAAENVALPLLLRGEGRRGALAAASSWLDALDIGEIASKPPGELSGGQAQRVALARAFAIRPQVIFADEPTGSLDSLAGEGVMDLMTASADEHGTTIVLVTHDARVAAYAQREIIVRDGIVSNGDLR